MEAKTMPTMQVTTGAIISRIESRSKYSAIRFERRVFNAITNSGGNSTTEKIRVVHSCSQDTAKCLYSCSFGAYQLMGFNIWGILEYSGKYADLVANHQVQDNLFQAFLINKGIAYSPQDLLDPVKRLAFALRYNGSKTYADLIKNSLDYYGVK